MEDKLNEEMIKLASSKENEEEEEVTQYSATTESDRQTNKETSNRTNKTYEHK